MLECWDLTTREERREGKRFYPGAQELAGKLSYATGYSLEQVAGVLAALSPNNSWRQNKLSALKVLTGEDEGVRSYRRDHIKALWILNGADPDAVLDQEKAPKTNAFYRLILQGSDSWLVCVDGHMANLIRGEGRPLKGIHLSLGQYLQMAQVVREAAKALRILPCELQAALWIAWRRSGGMKQGRVRFA